MRNALIAVPAAVLVGLGLVAAGLADNGNDTPIGGGHTPVTICHKPGTPAEHTLVVDDDSVELTGHLGHGDTLGACPDEPPVDTTPTDTTPTDTTPTPVDPGPGHDCTFVGADKDGGADAYGGTNDDCAPAPEVTPSVPADPPTTTATPSGTTSSLPAATGTSSATSSGSSRRGGGSHKPKTIKQKKAAKKAAVKIVKTVKKGNGIVVITTADGKKHNAVMGSG